MMNYELYQIMGDVEMFLAIIVVTMNFNDLELLQALAPYATLQTQFAINYCEEYSFIEIVEKWTDTVLFRLYHAQASG